MFQVEANIHSRKGTAHPTDTVTITEYKGQHYTAIFNPFVEMFYVDDIYGRLVAE